MSLVYLMISGWIAATTTEISDIKSPIHKLKTMGGASGDSAQVKNAIDTGSLSRM
jgi:hypothetical protein